MRQIVRRYRLLAPSRRGNAICFLTVFLTLPFAFNFTFAQQVQSEFPERPVSIVVPFPAGGRTDLNARIIAEAMAAALGNPVQVVNCVGAGGTVAARQVMTSKPDGHMLLFTSAALLISGYTMENAPQLDDFEPLAIVSETSPILFTRQDSGWNSVQDLVADARQRPESLLIGGITGGTSQILAAGFMQAAGIKMTLVPFKGDADAIVALAGGHIDAYISGLPSAKSMLDAEKLRPLAIVGNKRVPGLPNLPLTKDAGIDFAGSLFDVVLVPKQTTEPLLNQLEALLKKVMNNPVVVAKADGIGLDFIFIGRSDAIAFLKSQDALYAATIRKLNLKQ